MNHPISRRKFSAVVGAGIIGGYHSSNAVAQSKSANEKLNLACIGTANRAGEDIKGVQHESIVALCDVDSKYLERRLASLPSAVGYADYREMLDKESDHIDAVVIGTTDHHHAPATIRAIKAGKHVYCEKPLTHTVEEARIIANAAKEAGVATQLGTQIHAEQNYRRVVEIIQAGTIGPVTDVHVWVGKGWGVDDRPLVDAPAPDYLDWDLWLGPAPERPYAVGRYHPAQWRRWWDFGQGTLGDMGCHYIDLPFWALGLRHPVEVEAIGPELHPQMAPRGLNVKYRFPSIDGKPAVNMTWYDGNMIPKKVNGIPVKANGVMFVGENGSMFADYTSYRLFPTNEFANFSPPEKTIADSIGHHREWLKACRDGSPTTCNFDYSGALTECVLLGNVAFRSGTKFGWDGANLKADNEKAQSFISKEYRSGWEVKI